MIFFFVILPLLLVVHVIRLATRPFRYGRYRTPYAGYGYRYGNGFGCGRRRGLGGSLFSILALVALDRFITGRRF